MKKLLLALFLGVVSLAADAPAFPQTLDSTQRADGARVLDRLIDLARGRA